MKTRFLFLILFIPSIILSQKVIEMEELNGVYLIPCKVNSIPMKFIFDTGASNVSISKTEAIFLFKQGLITKSDIIGNTEYTIANGSVVKGALIKLKKIEISGVILENIVATVIDNDNAPLLLGQNVIQKLGNISFEGNKLILNEKMSKSECSFSDIFPFKIGNTKFDVSQIQNSTKSLKNQSDEFGLNHIFDEANNGFKKFKNVENKIYINVINLDYNNNKCLPNRDNHIQLVLANDYLYKATITIRFDKNSYELMMQEYNQIISYIPNEYEYSSKYFINDKDTNEKIGEGLNFYNERPENRDNSKDNKISVGFETKYNGTYNSESKTMTRTNEVLSYVIYIDIVDLRNTLLTNEHY